MMSGFQLRTACGDNDDDGWFVIHAFDSALPYLASIGSEAQWGTQPFSEKPALVATILGFIRDPSPPWKRMVIAETHDGTRVAAMGLSDEMPGYVKDIDIKNRADDFVYLNYLIIHRNTGADAKGSGAELIKEAIQECKRQGKKRILSDCWRGNGDGLMR